MTLSKRAEADTTALAAETRRARALGFVGKPAVHLAQRSVIDAAFAPSQEEVAKARCVVVELETAACGTRGSTEG
jgi:citrate lyase subunit beta / citryl-CoA lyase